MEMPLVPQPGSKNISVLSWWLIGTRTCPSCSLKTSNKSKCLSKSSLHVSCCLSFIHSSPRLANSSSLFESIIPWLWFMRWFINQAPRLILTSPSLMCRLGTLKCPSHSLNCVSALTMASQRTSHTFQMNPIWFNWCSFLEISFSSLFWAGCAHIQPPNLVPSSTCCCGTLTCPSCLACRRKLLVLVLLVVAVATLRTSYDGLIKCWWWCFKMLLFRFWAALEVLHASALNRGWWTHN
jgi:hypothetical protein